MSVSPKTKTDASDASTEGAAGLSCGTTMFLHWSTTDKLDTKRAIFIFFMVLVTTVAAQPQLKILHTGPLTE